MTTANTGRIVWYELFTSDRDAAVAFYTDVMGWKAEPWGPEGYRMFSASQGPVGGADLIPAAAKAMGVPPYWQAAVWVDDIAAAVEKATSLGAKIYHRESVPTVGDLAVIADPQGAVICLFQPSGDNAPHDRAKPGEFSWHELYTTDQPAALAFYKALVGWEQLGSFDMGPMGTYVLWGKDGVQLGGMMTMPPGMTTPDGKPLPPNWMYYVTVADFDAALERAKAKGARVLNGPMEVPGGQRIVQLLDPQGAAIALTEPPKSSA